MSPEIMQMLFRKLVYVEVIIRPQKYSLNEFEQKNSWVTVLVVVQKDIIYKISLCSF